MSFKLFQAYILLTFFRPVELFAPELGELRPMLWLWLLAVITSVVAAAAKKEAGARPIHFKLLFWLWALIGVSKLLSPWAGGTMEAISDFSTSSMLFLLAALNLTTLDRLKSTMNAVVLAMVLNSVIGINAYHTGQYREQLVLYQTAPAHDNDDPATMPDLKTVIPAHDDSGWFLWRLKSVGFLADPNDFAQVLVMSMPMLWAGWRAGQRLRNLVMVIAPGAAMIYAIFLSQSRGALIGLASLLFFGVRKALGTTKTVLLLGVMAGAQLVGNMSGGREFSGKERSAEERIESWTIGLDLLKGHPIFGAGYGNYLEYNYLTAHNSFVLCFAELGLVGYFVWMGMIVLTYKGLSRTLDQLPEGSPAWKTASLLRSSMVGYLTCAWFLSRTYGPALFFLMALGIGAWHCAVRSMPASQVPAPLLRIDWQKDTLRLMGMTIFAVYMFVRSH
ncbi:O-antigen ligase family protein [Sphaerotilus uruguayifluvii]|uniref:O-antigen ligase-related domain-containing protein n=1 Tax=Sphaerotilus uruguayifluvii TaxID=2735897 RepID=A0ABX2G1W6_9BURK|nr:O-antigen ligase family protein [Leptothrix sp. C29]NRT56054.1 hypothetical protein [Leptothrix sp. C29]